jgi:hypothetical protein
LNFLIDGVLQKFVKLLNFLFDLADIREFDFDGRTEAMAAVLWQTELLAVIGAEFDSHDVCFGGGMWARKSQTLRAWLYVWFWVVVIYAACASTVTSLGVSSASFRVVA